MSCPSSSKICAYWICDHEATQKEEEPGKNFIYYRTHVVPVYLIDTILLLHCVLPPPEYISLNSIC